MVEKTQKLIEHIKNHRWGLSLTANIRENLASVKMYDNYAMTNSQLLHVTISNLWDLENQLWRLWIEVKQSFAYLHSTTRVTIRMSTVFLRMHYRTINRFSSMYIFVYI